MSENHLDPIYHGQVARFVGTCENDDGFEEPVQSARFRLVKPSAPGQIWTFQSLSEAIIANHPQSRGE